VVVLVTVFCLISVADAYDTRLHKLASGIKQIVTAPFSIITVPAEQIENNSHDKLLALVGGLMEGAAQTAFKPIQGLFNILTFPLLDF